MVMIQPLVVPMQMMINKSVADTFAFFQLDFDLLPKHKKEMIYREYNVWQKIFNINKSIDLDKFFDFIEHEPHLKNILQDIFQSFAKLKATILRKDNYHEIISAKGKDLMVMTDFLDEKFCSLYYSSLFNAVIYFIIQQKNCNDARGYFEAAVNATFGTLQHDIATSIAETHKNLFHYFYPEFVNHNFVQKTHE